MKALTPNDSRYSKLEHKIYDRVTKFFVIVIASVLTDKLGFNASKTKAVLTQIQERADSIIKGYMSLEDLEQTLQDEYNLTLK